MAAEPSLDWVSALPWAWGYGITRGGRVFFINEEAKSTTWLHPVTGEAVLTGHRKTPDLPTGWEEGYTFEGARYYINHNERKVTCKHPVTAQPSQDNCIFVVNEQTSSTMTSQENKDRSVSMTSDASNGNTVPSALPTSPVTRSSRSSGKVHNFGKRSNSIKRNPNAPVIMRSWLYKKANSGMKLWKKRWFVLSDLCLFYYRDEKEEGVLGSILLPSFQISSITPEDHINRMFSFKATHSNMRTYYFCTDTAKEMDLWIKVMSDASLLHSESSKRSDTTKSENSASQEINHIANHKLLIRPEANNNQKNRDYSKVEEKKAREAERYGFQKDGQDRPLTKINSVRHQYSTSDYEILAASTAQYRAIHTNGPENKATEQHHKLDSVDHSRAPDPESAMMRSNSLLQLEQWIRTQRDRSTEEESRGVTNPAYPSPNVMSYQTLPRNMPSYRAQVAPRYPEGYRTLPRNPKPRPESLCSTTGMSYDRTMVPMTTTEDKRRSIRDDTMWQLYEWQQRQFYNKQTTLRRHASLTSPKTMVHISEQALHSIPLSPSHGSISGYHTYSPHRAYRSEVSSPVQRGDITIDRKKSHPSKHAAYTPDRRSMPAGLPLQPITPQGLQGKSMTQDECRSTVYKYRSDEVDIDAKLSSLCEQDKVVQALEKKLQQLHKEKYTLEQALLSASQEIEMNTDNPAAIQSVVLQRDDLQNGLLSTCREVSRATTELERSWKDYDTLEHDVTATRNQMREQLDRLGEVQTESAGIQRAQMQKEIWRIQDVMEGLSKNKQQRRSADPAGNSDSHLFSSGLSTNEGPDYRLYKSEPELTTVAEVDESNGDDKADHSLDHETSTNKGSHFPVGVVPPRTKSPPLESTTIASYVTLRKNKKLETKSERPRSAVEHLCIADSPRPRMTVEEQLERMRRHQQACLKEKKRGLSFIGTSDQSLSQSPSISRENSFKITQVRKREEKLFSNIKDLENAVRENNLEQQRESPAQEILRLKEAAEEPEAQKESADLSPPESKDEPTKDDAQQPDPTDALQALVGTSLEVVSVANHKSESSQSENKTNEQERTGIIFYEFSSDALRRHTSLEGDLSSLPEPPTLPVGPAQPQLTEGSHFMCV